MDGQLDAKMDGWMGGQMYRWIDAKVKKTLSDK
jgi:hypothetical protein